ncbi:MAG: caspase family protein, partial [Nitratireductor sp.]
MSRFARAVHEAGAWRLSASAGGDAGLANAVLDIERAGAAQHRIENDAATGFAHAAFSLLADGTGLVTGGTDGTLIDYALQTGRYRGEFLDGHTGEIHAIAEAEEAGLLLTGSADQTVRLWNLKTRTLIASMFFAEAEWIIWVPQGYYYSSPGGDALVGWHVNQGPDSEARFVRARQLKQYLFSPEIVRRAIVLADSAAAVRELRGTDAELDRLLARKPPEFQVRLVDNQDEAREGFVSIEISGAERAGTSVADFAILSNARRVASFATRSAAGGGDAIVVEVPVEDGDNEIVISGVNEYGYLTERSVKAVGRKARGRERAGTLYLLAIGVESYPLLPTACGGRACDLAYPVDDAVKFARLVAEKAAPLYERMKAQLFVNRSVLEESPELDAALSALPAGTRVLEPESDTILDEIEDFLDQAGPQDTTIVFVAGHGINIDEDYYFIPTDGRKRDDRWRRSSLVDWETIQRGVERAKGRRFMLLDTCHAANAFNPRLEKDAEDARIIVFSATAANNTAAELPELGHGVFTHSLLAGLKGGADPTGEGVRLLALADFIDREVRRLTNARQVPE